MHDKDIREVLLDTLFNKHRDDNDTLIVEELGLCQGDARIDIAVVNGSIHGFEIKSESDTLNRLSGQQNIYNKIFDYITVVANSCHISTIEKRIPRWWGISEIKIQNGILKIVKIRANKRNVAIDPNALVQLLWSEEAYSILRERNLHKGLSGKTRKILWDAIVENISIKELKDIIRAKLKSRQYWRPAARPM